MAEERRQNIFITLATNKVALRKMDIGLTLDYPISESQVVANGGMLPYMVMIKLGDNAISLEDCESCIGDLVVVLKSLGCKMTGDIDVNYCIFDVDGGEKQVMAEYMLSYILK